MTTLLLELVVAASFLGPVSAQAGPPSDPVPFTVQRTGEGDEATLIWGVPDANADAVAGYRIHHGTDPNALTVIATIAADQHQFVDHPTPPGLHFYRVQATSAAGNGTPTPVESVETVVARPTPPRDPQASPGNGQITLSWTPPQRDGGDAVSEYQVFRGTDCANKTQVATVPGGTTSAVDGGLVNGQTYCYNVKAVNDVGASDPSPDALGTPRTVPDAPQLASAGAGPGAGKITVSWAAPTFNGGAAITSYDVYRSTTSGGPFSVIGSVSSNPAVFFDDFNDGVVDASKWPVTANARETTTCGGQSPPRSLYFDGSGDRLATTGPLNVAGGGTVSFFLINGIGATACNTSDTGEGIALEYSINAGSTWTVLRTYLSEFPVFRQIQEPIPTAAQTASTMFRWRQPNHSGGTGNDDWAIDDLSITPSAARFQFTDSGLPNGATRFYVVGAVNGAGGGTTGAEASATTAVAPGAPTTLQAAPWAAGSLRLTWASPASAGGLPVTSYSIYRGTSAGTETFLTQVGPLATSFVDSGLPNAALRFYRVSASNGAGEGPQSAGASATTVTVPTAPQNLQATRASQAVSLSWSAPTSNGGLGVTQYKVYRGTSCATKALVTSTTAPAFTNSGLTNGQSYCFHVTAVNGAGEGAASADALATPATIPGIPTGLSALRGNELVGLSWQAPASNGGSALTNYKVERSTDHGLTFSAHATIGVQETYQDTGLTNGQEYCYRVRAKNDVGDGSVSGTTCATPSRVPTAPQNLAASPGSSAGQVLTCWDAPAFVGDPAFTKYTLYRGAATSSEIKRIDLPPTSSPSGCAGRPGFVDDVPVDDVTYFYTATATNGFGESPVSNESSSLPG